MKKQLSDEQIRRAKEVPLIEYLKKRGYELKRDGAHYVRLVEHDSLVVSIEKNLWKWNAGEIGGDTINFLVDYEKKGFVDAVIELTEEFPAGRIDPIPRRPKALPKERRRELPSMNETHNRVYAYLTKSRGIAPSIVRYLLKEQYVYESADHHNAVFVRYVSGVPRYCFIRGTNTYGNSAFKGETSWAEKEYAWMVPGTDRRCVYVFEAAIDALSYATLIMAKGGDWKRFTLLTLGGASLNALRCYLKEHPECNSGRIVVCTDRDAGGDLAAATIETEFGGGYEVIRHLPPFGNDWNDTLTAYRNKQWKLGGFTLCEKVK